MLNSILNGQKVNKTFVIHRKNKSCLKFLDILWDEGYILGYKVYKEKEQYVTIFLKYMYKDPIIKKIKFISKSGRRVYCSNKELWKITLNNSLLIISTTQGVLSLDEARNLNIGGELFCLIK